MNLQLKTINNASFIPYRVIARTSADHFYQESNAAAHEDDRVSPAEFLVRHAEAVKAHLLRLNSPTNSAFVEGQVVQDGLEVWASKEAFFELVQLYNWPEDYFVAILAAMGEYGDQFAVEIRHELEHTPLAASAVVGLIKGSSEYRLKRAA